MHAYGGPGTASSSNLFGTKQNLIHHPSIYLSIHPFSIYAHISPYIQIFAVSSISTNRFIHPSINIQQYIRLQFAQKTFTKSQIPCPPPPLPSNVTSKNPMTLVSLGETSHCSSRVFLFPFTHYLILTLCPYLISLSLSLAYLISCPFSSLSSYISSFTLRKFLNSGCGPYIVLEIVGPR